MYEKGEIQQWNLLPGTSMNLLVSSVLVVYLASRQIHMVPGITQYYIIVPTSRFAESRTFLAEKTLSHFVRVGDTGSTLSV